MIRLVLASGNKGKHAEFKRFFEEIGADVSLAIASEIEGAKAALDAAEENGETYEENALIKAIAIADATGMPTIADDSGIEVAALGGAPGIRSARAWPGSDADRVSSMLDAIERSSTPDDRRAEFVCCIVIAYPSRFKEGLAAMGAPDHHTSVGRCPGTLARAPRGSNGFGYDPIFIPDGETLTFGELPAEKKSSISHRALAMRGVADIIPLVIEYSSALR